MKVIDLLNKIANGEISIGTHIVYRDNELIFTGSCLENIKEKSALAMFGLDNLNNEVEIIEEDKKIEKIDLSDWAEITYSEDWKILTYDFNRNSNLFVDKINEIIDKLNEGKE